VQEKLIQKVAGEYWDLKIISKMYAGYLPTITSRLLGVVRDHF